MSDDLVAFLRARLNEDERTARRAGDSFRQVGETGVIVATEGDRAEECASAYWAGVAEHIVRHDPARVLREVEAKRGVLELHAPRERGDGCVVCDDGNDSCGCLSGPNWSYPCDTVKILALPYADHPGYDEGWRP